MVNCEPPPSPLLVVSNSAVNVVMSNSEPVVAFLEIFVCVVLNVTSGGVMVSVDVTFVQFAIVEMLEVLVLLVVGECEGIFVGIFVGVYVEVYVGIFVGLLVGSIVGIVLG